MISDDLRRQADQFVEIKDLIGLIGRPEPEKTATREEVREDELVDDLKTYSLYSLLIFLFRRPLFTEPLKHL